MNKLSFLKKRLFYYPKDENLNIIVLVNPNSKSDYYTDDIVVTNADISLIEDKIEKYKEKSMESSLDSYMAKEEAISELKEEGYFIEFIKSTEIKY